MFAKVDVLSWLLIHVFRRKEITVTHTAVEEIMDTATAAVVR